MRTKNQPVAAPMQQLFLQETRDIKNVVKTMTEILEGELEDCKTVTYYLLHSDTKHKHCIITDEGQEIIISFGSAKKGGSHD